MLKTILLKTKSLKQTEIIIGENINNQLYLYLNNFNPSKVVYVTEERLLSRLMSYIPQVKKDTFVLKNGEAEKNWQNLENILNFFFTKNIDKKSVVVAFGGGKITDIVGLSSSIFYRGIPVIFIPTTLLSQIDAAIGGKNTINFKNNKNILGTIYQPKLILIDILFLESLPKRELSSGMAEVIKYGVGLDKNLFRKIQIHNFSNKQNFLPIVQRCVEIKTNIVQKDLDESKGIRKLLNLGHTLGQSLESEKNFNLNHGEAVSIGLLFSAFISREIGNFSNDEFNKIKNVMNIYGLPPKVYLDTKIVLNKMKHDKKRSGDFIEFILIRKIGESYIREITFDILGKYLYKFRSFY